MAALTSSPKAQLLANASDIDGPSLTATGLMITSGTGKLIDNGDGTWLYTPAPDDDTAVGFSYNISDTETTIMGSAILDLIPVNDAPKILFESTQTYTPDTPLNFNDIVISDNDSDYVTLTFSLSNPAAGVLSPQTSSPVTQSYNPVTGVWIASGAIKDINAVLANLVFIPNANFKGNFSIAMNVSDGITNVTEGKAIGSIAIAEKPIHGQFCYTP